MARAKTPQNCDIIYVFELPIDGLNRTVPRSQPWMKISDSNDMVLLKFQSL